MLEVQGLTFYYKKYRICNVEKTKILNNITFGLKNGEIIALVGKSGSGKSTLAKILARLIKIDSKTSKIYLNKRHINDFSPKIFYKNVQILLQDSINSLNPRLNIFGNLSEPLVYLLNISNSKINNLIEKILEKVELDKDILFKYPSMISGGQAQRVCIAKGLLTNARIFLLDEITSNLDFLTQCEIMQNFVTFVRERGAAAIFVTHDLDLAGRYCDRILMLENGKLSEM